MKLSPQKIKDFQREIRSYYKKNSRTFQWRETTDPYKILVSEIMLQQTQTSRVAIKYKSFLKRFPNTKSLALAPLSDVLKEWQGLGYNRRALYLKKTAEVIHEKYKGKFPQTREELITLPGIGQSTAGALMAFAWNKPVAFIETNIRTVFFYFFFTDSSSVSDTMLTELIEQTIDQKNPRDWYYALYDYGSMLKAKNKEMRTLHQKSAHYKKQSKFEGSNRQIRSHLLKALIASKKKVLSSSQLVKQVPKEKEFIEKNLLTMQKEGLIMKTSAGWSLA